MKQRTIKSRTLRSTSSNFLSRLNVLSDQNSIWLSPFLIGIVIIWIISIIYLENFYFDDIIAKCEYAPIAGHKDKVR